MKFNTAEQVVENFILWYTSDEKEREQLISTINDPMITYLNYEDIDLGDDNSRLEDNIRNVMTWINRQGFHGKELLRLLNCTVQYFTEDHVDGLESFGNYTVDVDVLECKEALKNLVKFQSDQIDPTVYRQLTELAEGMSIKPSEALVKRFRTTYNYLSTKQECILEEAPIAIQDYTVVADKLIPFDYIPVCYKIEDKVYLLGGLYKFTYEDEGDAYEMCEFFDMTTEMATGHSYSFYATNSGQFRAASKEERLAVKDFLESIK